MQTLKTLSITAMLGLAVIGFSGCSTAQKGAAGGGLVGGIAGSIVGNNIPAQNPQIGAVIGGSSGAAVGGLSGDAYDQVTKKDIEREIDNLRAELSDRERELAALRDSGLSPDALAELNEARAEIGRLQAALEASERERHASLDNMEADLAAAQERNNALRQEIDGLNARVGELTASAHDKARENEELARAIEAKQAEMAALQAQIGDKESELESLSGELNMLRTSLSGKEEMLSKMSSELEDLNVKMEQTSRGLTLTIVDSLLYEPGEAMLSPAGRELIGDVSRIIQENFPGRELMIEGHTDNQPIVHSGWRSNWELGAARALTLLHELVGNHGLSPDKVSATSYGEFRPAATNSTPEGRRENRRAVIVIMPDELTIERESLAQAN